MLSGWPAIAPGIPSRWSGTPTTPWAHDVGLYAKLLDTPPAWDYRVDEVAKKLAGYNPEAVRKLKEIFWAGTEAWPELPAAWAEISVTLVFGEYTNRAIGGSR